MGRNCPNRTSRLQSAELTEVGAIDVSTARRKLGVTQSAFSRCLGVALPTLRKWEQGARRPEGPAQVLLRVIQSEPDAVRRALDDHDS